MFEVLVEEAFSAAHALRHYHGTGEASHRHKFRVQVAIRGKALKNKVKYLVDFAAFKRALHAVIRPMDHANLNAFPPFHREDPSAENIAVWIHRQLQKGWRARGARIASVTVWETPTSAARYLP